MYVATTQGIEIEVEPEFIPSESHPGLGHYVFAYRVRLTNRGEQPAKLVSRHWLITDGLGRTREVKGPGVIGETPRLAPGESFEYSSFCPIQTPSGTMRGSYEMVRDSGETFEAAIPLFFLQDLREVH
jgi:ApaG protein